MREIKTLGIDLAKNFFQIHGNDERGRVVIRRKVSRRNLMKFVANLKPCLIGMEACAGSNYWAREFKKLGHEVKLMAAQYVKPYVKTNKHDMADAEAIAEAVRRPNMRFVAIKEIHHQDIQMIHRIRQRLVRNRTALSNEIRSLLHEYGIVIPQGISNVKKKLVSLEEDKKLSILAKRQFRRLYEELRSIEERIKEYEDELILLHKGSEISQRIFKIEGVGLITTTAILAALPDPSVFKNGRGFSAWLGLVPKQASSGGKQRLLGISKRGDRYIRTLLIHGARTVLRHAPPKKDKKSMWIKRLKDRRGFNTACVALANKHARIIWALLSKKEEYRFAA